MYLFIYFYVFFVQLLPSSVLLASKAPTTRKQNLLVLPIQVFSYFGIPAATKTEAQGFTEAGDRASQRLPLTDRHMTEHPRQCQRANGQSDAALRVAAGPN